MPLSILKHFRYCFLRGSDYSMDNIRRFNLNEISLIFFGYKSGEFGLANSWWTTEHGSSWEVYTISLKFISIFQHIYNR